MNSGRTIPSGQPGAPPFPDNVETVRQFISDLTVKLLADIYDYTVTLPSELYSPRANQPTDVGAAEVLPADTFSFGTAHITLDQVTGTLLVQGLAQDPSDVTMTVDDTIDFLIDDMGTTTDTSDDEIEIDIAYTLDDGTVRNITRRVHAERVSHVLIAGNGGTDNITVTKNGVTQPLANAAMVDAAFAAIAREVDYVVSTNEDAVDGNLADNVFDLDAVVPGNQVSLRGAIQNANGDTSATIYVPRSANPYLLDIIGIEDNNDSAAHDLDINGNVTIIGGGAGLTVIDASGLGGSINDDRVFDVWGTLDLSQVTVTRGDLPVLTNGTGGGIIVRNGGGNLTLSEAALVNNSANTGGAIRVVGDATATITRSLFAENMATANGGAIFADAGSTISISESVFANNSSQSGNANVVLPTGAINGANNLVDAADGFFTTTDDQILATAPDHIVNSLNDVKIDSLDDETSFSLREAVAANNSAGTAQSILLPAWTFVLARTGDEGSESNDFNDLDLTGDATITGVGPGLTVIDASGLGSDNFHDGTNFVNALDDRHFDLGANAGLNLSRLTLTGGDTKGDNGQGDKGSAGAIYVRGTNANLDLSTVAVVGNHAAYKGGAIRVMTGGVNVVMITGSVFTDNHAGSQGGVLWAHNNMDVSVGSSIFANNSDNGTYPHIRNGNVINLGNNLTDNDQSGVFFDSQDYAGTVDYVVTSIADTYDHSDDGYSLSLREAVDLANGTLGVNDEIWVAAWEFRLTRAYDFSQGPEGQDISVGDLDITDDSLTVRGILGHTNIQWRAGVVDKVFELEGDYNNDGIVNSADFTVWRDNLGAAGNDLLADGDEDGVVDGDDYTVWSQQFGEQLTLASLTLAGTSYDGDGNEI